LTAKKRQFALQYLFQANPASVEEARNWEKLSVSTDFETK
jgi:hypothetical protein